MNKPTELEVNKKLAEYEGKKDPYLFKRGDIRRVIYTESLDAQTPIKKKLNSRRPFRISELFLISDNWYVKVFKYRPEGEDFKLYSEATKEELPKASAYALYYAILEDEK